MAAEVSMRTRSREPSPSLLHTSRVVCASLGAAAAASVRTCDRSPNEAGVASMLPSADRKPL